MLDTFKPCLRLYKLLTPGNYNEIFSSCCLQLYCFQLCLPVQNMKYELNLGKEAEKKSGNSVVFY